MNAFSILLQNYIDIPNNAESNWEIALYYDSIGQTASAVSFYLRAAERTDDTLLKYECLLKSAICFQKQGSRNFTVKGLLQHAITIQPTRPEAYFLLSRHYEREKYDGHWNDCYMIASIGQSIYNRRCVPLRTDVEYPPGEYGLLFEKAVSSWWCGLCDESRDLFTNLLLQHPLDTVHYITVFSNLKFLKSPYTIYEPFEIYRFYEHDRLKLKFENSEVVTRNYSEAFQDMFVLTMLNGKKGGTYLEIGSGHPIYGNNTILLETKFDWRGVSIDVDDRVVTSFHQSRNNTCIRADATQLDYNTVIQENFGDTDYIDYLQIDCDPPEVSYQALLKIDFQKVRFGVITFEHDYYADASKSIQNMANEFLSAHGYQLVANHVSPDGTRSYEDWWVHPDYVKLDRIAAFSQTSDFVKNAKQLFLTI